MRPRTLVVPRFRKPRFQTLEGRRLLAGDVCVESHDDNALRNQPFVDVAATQAAPVSAADAGDTLSSAHDLGAIDHKIQLSGALSATDRVDIVRFSVERNADVRLAIDRLNRNADLYLLSAQGEIVASSTHSGTSVDGFRGRLAAGEYFLAVVAGSFRQIRYRLTLDVELDSASPSLETPSSEFPGDPTTTPGASPVASPPPPATVEPLAGVAYYGGSNDWNLNAVEAPEAWAAGFRGQGVTVAVIDTGVDLDHPDLVNNLYINPGEIAGNGIDDDRNGYIDDVSGYDFVSGDARPDDGNGHGTHVAGTIAATQNGFGVTGVAPDAKILPVRVLDDSGSGSDFSVAAGIRYAAEVGAQIINLSLGGSYSSRIQSAIDYAVSLGAFVVAASGNESASDPSYPARQSAQSTGVLSVGAFDSQNKIASFSNAVGRSDAIQVDAPGVRVYSTYVGARYGSMSGTSMASPHVAGVAALTLSANPDLTSKQLRDLLATGTVGSAVGSDSIGMVSALYSVAYAAAGRTAVTTASTTQAAASSTIASSTVKASRGPLLHSTSDFLAQPIAVTSFQDRGAASNFDDWLSTPKPLASETVQDKTVHERVFQALDDWNPGPEGHGAQSLFGRVGDAVSTQIEQLS